MQAGIRVLVREGGREVARLLPEMETRGHVEVVVRKWRVAVHGGEVVPDVCVVFEVVADGGAGPVPRAPEEGFVLGLEVLGLILRVEERAVAVVVQAALVRRRVGVGLVHGAGPKLGVIREVVEGHHAVAVAPAERAEGGFFLWVDVHVDALAVGTIFVSMHFCVGVVWFWVLFEILQKNQADAVSTSFIH